MSPETPPPSPPGEPGVGENGFPEGSPPEPANPAAGPSPEGLDPETSGPMLDAIAAGAVAAGAGVTNVTPPLGDRTATEPVVEESETQVDQRDGLIGLGGRPDGESAASPAETIEPQGTAEIRVEESGTAGLDEQPGADDLAEGDTQVDVPDAPADESPSVRDELAGLKEQFAESLGRLQGELQGELSEIREQIVVNQRGLSKIGQFIQSNGRVFERTEEIVKTSAETVSRVEEEANRETRQPFIESLMQVHDQLFRRMNAMEAGEKKPDAFVVQLFETLEAEFRQNGIEIIRPEPGGAVELNCMRLLEQVKCPFWRRQDSVHKVFRCGFRYTDPERIIRKAEVAVYRKDVGE